MNKRILVIDDTKNIRFMLSTCFEGEGYAVDTAENGQEGIQFFEQNTYDLVMLDIRMPHMSGTEVLTILKEKNHKVPILIMTAFGTVKNAIECVRAGAIDYIRKPFSVKKIREVVQEILQRTELEAQNIEDYATCIRYIRKCMQNQNFEEAKEMIKKAISMDIDKPDAYCLIGMIIEQEGNIEESIKYHKVALQFDPNYEISKRHLERLQNEK